MTIGYEEVGPAVGRMLAEVFDDIATWSRREQASGEIPARAPILERHAGPPPPLPLVSNLVVRTEANQETIAWLDLHSRKYTLKREYLLDGNPLGALRDPHASLREFFASRRGTLAMRLSLLDHSERLLFRAAVPGEVEAFTPGRWVEDFLALSEAIARLPRPASEEALRLMMKLSRLDPPQEEPQ